MKKKKKPGCGRHVGNKLNNNQDGGHENPSANCIIVYHFRCAWLFGW